MSGYRDNQRGAIHVDEDFARGVLKSALAPGEMIVWANRPKRGIPLGLIGLHGLFERYIVDAWQRRDMVYGLTNRRLLIAPRAELRAVPDAEAVHRLPVEAQAAAPELAEASRG